MDLIQSAIIRFVCLAIFGVIAAFAAKHFGLEKSAVGTGMIGACVGWGAYWLWDAWLGLRHDGKLANNPNRPRKAPLQEESDKTITLQTPASKKSFSKDEERP